MRLFIGNKRLDFVLVLLPAEGFLKEADFSISHLSVFRGGQEVLTSLRSALVALPFTAVWGFVSDSSDLQICPKLAPLLLTSGCSGLGRNWWTFLHLTWWDSGSLCSVVGAVGETMMAFIKDLLPNMMKLREKTSSLDLWPSCPPFVLLQHHMNPGV